MKTIWYILDGNEYDENISYTREELENSSTAICESWSKVRKETKELLEDYYECSSEYGNPIHDLLQYIPDNKIKDLLEEFNYILKEMEV